MRNGKFNKVFLLLGFLAVVAGCGKVDSDNSRFFMPAEWEPHEAVWLGWEGGGRSYYPVVVEVLKALTPHVPIKIAIDSDSLMQICRQALNKYNIDTTNVSLHVMKGERYWIRDHGAAFLVNTNGELAIADFGWNLYGLEGWFREKFENNADSVEKYMTRSFDKDTGVVDSLMGVAENAQRIEAGVVIEGGAIEVNGKGTLILCEDVALQRNPGKSKSAIENEFKKALGVSKVIWLKKGLIEDAHIRQLHFKKYVTMGTGGHTDEFVRFVSPTTILLAWVDEGEIDKHPFNKVNHERMKENYEILKRERDQDGKPFTIIKIPLPDPIERKVVVREKYLPSDSLAVRQRSFINRDAPKVGDTLLNVASSSYLNYLVTNGVVLLPTYVAQGSSREKEETVRRIMHDAYPGRELVWIDCMPLNWDGGGIHCSTQQQPKRINP